jgi:hypothetical protein
MRWRSCRDWKGSTRMALESQWYASMMYWLPLRDRTGKHPISSVKSLLMGSVQMGISVEGEAGMLGAVTLDGSLGFVERMPWRT